MTNGRSNELHIEKKNLSDQILDYITSQIVNGELKPGDKLPTEVEYSEMFGVSRHAVREAVRALTAMGIVEIRRAEGTFVVDHYTKELLNPIVYGLILHGQDIDALLEMNSGIIREILYLARIRMDEDDRKQMENAYRELYDLVTSDSDDVDLMTEKSRAFYHELAVMSKNAPMTQVYDVILEILTQTRHKGFEYVVRENARTEWMKNYEEIMRYLRGEDISGREISQGILQIWRDTLA